MAKSAIKSDNKKQNILLSPSLDELIPENHFVRVVDAVIDCLDISDILSTYRCGVNSAFNPKMMLKVLSDGEHIQGNKMRKLPFLFSSCVTQIAADPALDQSV